MSEVLWYCPGCDSYLPKGKFYITIGGCKAGTVCIECDGAYQAGFDREAGPPGYGDRLRDGFAMMEGEQ